MRAGLVVAVRRAVLALRQVPAGRSRDGLGRLVRYRALPVVAHICGTEGDPQGLEAQRQALVEAGVLLAPSNAAAATVGTAMPARKKETTMVCNEPIAAASTRRAGRR